MPAASHRPPLQPSRKTRRRRGAPDRLSAPAEARGEKAAGASESRQGLGGALVTGKPCVDPHLHGPGGEGEPLGLSGDPWLGQVSREGAGGKRRGKGKVKQQVDRKGKGISRGDGDEAGRRGGRTGPRSRLSSARRESRARGAGRGGAEELTEKGRRRERKPRTVRERGDDGGPGKGWGRRAPPAGSRPPAPGSASAALPQGPRGAGQRARRRRAGRALREPHPPRPRGVRRPWPRFPGPPRRRAFQGPFLVRGRRQVSGCPAPLLLCFPSPNLPDASKVTGLRAPDTHSPAARTTV